MSAAQRGAAALVPPPVSMSNTRVYYMDAQGVVRYLAPNGDAGRATTVPIGPARRAMFAVSPDDQRIAVIVAVSGYGRQDDRRKSLEAGFDHHFVKPVDPDDLIAILERGRPARNGSKVATAREAFP